MKMVSCWEHLHPDNGTSGMLFWEWISGVQIRGELGNGTVLMLVSPTAEQQQSAAI